jgi:hypothetical protein
MRVNESNIPIREFRRELRGANGVAATVPASSQSTVGSDLRLFAMTFAGGFLFMAIYLA